MVKKSMINEQDIRNTYKFLNHKKETELRAIIPFKKGSRVREATFIHSEEEFLSFCKKWNGKANIYVGINERKHKGTKREDVTSVKTIVIDIDAIRKDMHQPATEEELERVDKLACQIQYDLLQRGFKKPIKCLSGNGYQLWFAIPEIKLTDENRESVEQKLQMFQEEMQQRYSNKKHGSIDKIGDLPRVIRVVGTMNIKGENTKERPHRLSRVIGDKFERNEDPKLRDYILGLKPEMEEIVVEENTPKYTDEEFWREFRKLCKKDKKLDDLFNNRLDEYKNEWVKDSRSEAEQSLVAKLVFYKFSKSQIYQIMDKCKIGKWQETGDSYKESTYKKAVKLTSKQKGDKKQKLIKENKVKIRKIKGLSVLKKILSKWLYIEDWEAVEVILATALSIKISGDSVWLFVIAPPGGMKTEILRNIKGDDVYTLSALTEHTLISGLKGSKSDLLPELDKKLLVVKDFTVVLSNDRERVAIFSQLRDAYDGYLEKAFGSGVGKKSYHATFGLLAGVTPVIDVYRSVDQLLGERFLKIRIRTNEERAIKQAQKNVGKETEMRVELSGGITSFLQNIKLRSIKIPGNIEKKILNLAMLVSKMRTGVARDRMHIVQIVPETEIGTRLVKQFKKLAISLALVRGKKNVTEKEYKTLIRVGLDMVTKKRLRVLHALPNLEDIGEKDGIEKKVYPSTKKVGDYVKMPTSTAREVLEDLWMLRLIKRRGVEESQYTWEIAEITEKLFENVGIDTEKLGICS